MSNSLQQIIKLIHKTGDRCVVLDTEGNPAYVIMGLEQYDQLVSSEKGIIGLTEAELMDKINRDIADWKAGQAENDQVSDVDELGSNEPEIIPENPQNLLNKANSEGSDEQYYFEPIE